MNIPGTEQVHPIVSAVRGRFVEAGNPEYAVKMQKYMKSKMEYHGIKTAGQRQITRIIFKENPLSGFEEYQTVIRELWSGKFREERYAAIRLACRYKEYQVMESLPLYRMMIETGAWWDFVDGIAIDLIGKLLADYPERMKEILNQWITDDDVWIRRSALLAQLRFKDRTDKDMLFEFCRTCLHEKIFWIRKAIGWVLREYSKIEPGLVRVFVNQHRHEMSGVTIREAEKYI